MTHQLTSLMIDCLSFTEGLITRLFTTEGEAPVSNSKCATSEFPFSAAW